MTAGTVACDEILSEGIYVTTVWYGSLLSQIVGTAIQHLQKESM